RQRTSDQLRRTLPSNAESVTPTWYCSRRCHKDATNPATKVPHRCAWLAPAAQTILPHMANPEALRRINQHEEDLRAIGDTVIDIKETVDRHTQELTTIK